MFGPFPFDRRDSFAARALELRPSGIPHGGLGVFAKQTLRRGQALGRYAGLGMTQAELDARYGDSLAPFALAVTCSRYADCRSGTQRSHQPHVVCVDAAQHANWASYVNDGPHSGLLENVVFGEDGTVSVVRTVRKGEELLVSYGSEYWEGKE